MKETHRVGLARFVMRERQNLAAIRVMGNGLVLHTVHYQDEVLSLDDALPHALARAKPAAKELAIARQLVDALTRPLDLSTFKDDYREALEELIDRKRAGKKTVAVADDHSAEPLPRTIDLMDALKRSLSAGPTFTRRQATRAPRPVGAVGPPPDWPLDASVQSPADTGRPACGIFAGRCGSVRTLMEIPRRLRQSFQQIRAIKKTVSQHVNHLTFTLNKPLGLQ